MQQSNTNHILHIKLLSYQCLQNKSYDSLWFEFKFLQKSYFSSLISIDISRQYIINDHFTFNILQDTNRQQLVKIIRWQNGIPIFCFSIELNQIMDKKVYKKTIQSKPKQNINLAISLSSNHQIQFSNVKFDQIAHYYCFDLIKIYPIANQQTKNTYDSILKIIVDNKIYSIPKIVFQSISILIQLPAVLRFQYFINNIQSGSAQHIDSSQLQANNKYNIKHNGNLVCRIQTTGKWGKNEQKHQDLSYVMQTNQLIIYEIELVLEKQSPSQIYKLKIMYNNKIYEIISDINNGKLIRFKKIMYTILRSQQEQINFSVQKNNLEICHFKILTDEFKSNDNIKKKLNDVNGKIFGNIKFKSEKSKSLSLPENNPIWRAHLNSRNIFNYLLLFDQISYLSTLKKKIQFVIKIGINDIQINNALNLSEFNHEKLGWNQSDHSKLFELKDQYIIYLIYQYNGNIQAMAFININQIKLGQNSYQIQMYKQQKKIGYVNMLINKIPNLQFCKFHIKNENLVIKKKNKKIFIQISPLTLSSYYYTYCYEKKNEIYCVVEIDNIKKVLILQKSPKNDLILIQSQGSDNLNFLIEQSQFIRVKVTFLISDLGFEQQIYGNIIFKHKFSDLEQNRVIKFEQTVIKNQYEFILGKISIIITLKQDKYFKYNSEQTQLKKIDKIDTKLLNLEAKNFKQKKFLTDKKHKSLNHNQNRNMSYIKIDNNKTNKHYIKLPLINKSLDMKLNEDQIKLKNDNKQMIQIEEDKLSENIKKLQEEIQYKKKYLIKNNHNQRIKLLKNYHNLNIKPSIKKNHDIENLKKMKFQNLQKHFDIIFPRKVKNSFHKILPIQSYGNQYQQKLKGLKSILYQINNDLKNVEPSLNSSKKSHNQQEQQKNTSEQYIIKQNLLNPADFEDNQFMPEQLMYK